MADKFQLKAILTGVDKFTPVLKGAQRKVLSMRKALLKSGFADFSFGDVLAGGVMAAPFVEASRAAIDFESAMADVRKVVDFPTPEAFKQMGDDIIEMSANMPMAAKDIAAIVAAGGQAGGGVWDEGAGLHPHRHQKDGEKVPPGEICVLGKAAGKKRRHYHPRPPDPQNPKSL